MAGNIANLFVVLGAKTEGLQKGLRDAEKAAIKASRSFEKTFGPALSAITSSLAVIGASAAAGFGALAASGLKANSQMEQYRTTLNTVMGDSQKAAETLNWVKEFAAKTPFEMPGLVESTVKLQALGMEAQKFLPAAADMAAVFASSGKTVQDAAEAMTDAAMGEFERLKEFGIKLGADDFKAGGKYAGMAYADAVLLEIKNKNYSGAADALSKTFTGRLSTLKDTFGQVLQKATAPVFEKISNSMGGLMAKIEELSASGALQAFTDKLTAGMTAAWNVLEKVAGAVVSIARGITDNWGVIGPVLAGVGAAFVALKVYAAALEARLIALKVAQIALNIAMGANPAGAIALALAALVMAGVALYQNWDTVKAKVSGAWEGVKSTVVNAANTVLAFLQEWGPLILAAITGPIGLIVYGIATHWDSIKAKTSEIWEGIKNGVVGAFQWMYDHNYYFQGLVDFIKGAWEAIKTFSSVVWNGIKDTLSGIWDAIRWGIEERWNAISTVTSEVWTAISGWLTGLWAQMEAQVTTVWNTIYGV
ncbi:MAG: tape measure protein, partial [Firmicutes bacterium]|nr:tape measure protein [Bacillota bacterium]